MRLCKRSVSCNDMITLPVLYISGGTRRCLRRRKSLVTAARSHFIGNEILADAKYYYILRACSHEREP